MLNVTIQNDGKIKIQTECSGVKEMRYNVNLLLALVSSMEMEEKANKGPVESYINNMKVALESVGCICEITKG
jgi:hypothetical protein